MNENLSENFASQEEIVNNGVTINGEDAISQKQIDNICDELYGLAYYNQDISATIADIKLNKINSPYINVTDIDMRQVAVKITDDIWLYSQSDDYIVDGESVIDGECDYDTNLLDFKAYSENEIKSGISCFYDSIEEVKNVYKDDWKQIALECAFEQGESKFSYGEHLKDELKNFSLISNDTKKDKPYKVVANIFYAPAEEVQSFDNQVDADALVEKLNDTNDMYTFFSVEKDEIKKVILCHSAFVKKYHGAVEKFEEEIRDIVNDDETRRIGYFVGGELKGYATYDFVSESEVNYALNRIEVSELIYSDGEVLRNLIGGLRMQSDLAQNIVIRTGEADFYHLLDSPQDISGNYIDHGFLQTNVSAMGTMYKIPDVKRFIEKTNNREFPIDNLKIAFRVNNEFKSSEERFGISFKSDHNKKYSNWSYVEDFNDADVEIKCNLSDLSSLLMGSANLAPLVRMGIVSINNDYETNRL